MKIKKIIIGIVASVVFATLIFLWKPWAEKESIVGTVVLESVEQNPVLEKSPQYGHPDTLMFQAVDAKDKNIYVSVDGLGKSVRLPKFGDRFLANLVEFTFEKGVMGRAVFVMVVPKDNLLSTLPQAIPANTSEWVVKLPPD